MFGKNPHLNITQCEIRADRYVGDSMVEWLDRKDIHGTLFEIIKLTEELEKSINKFKLGNISREEAVEMIRKRIGSLRFISDQNIIKIFNKSTNPRAFLKNSENVCRYAFEKGDKEVAEKHIKKVLR